MDKESQKFLKQITPLLNEVYGVDFDNGVEKQAAGWGTVVNAGRTLLTRLIPRLGRKTAPVMDDLLVGGGRAVRQGGRDLGRDMMRSGLMAGDDVAAGAAKAAPKVTPKVVPEATEPFRPVLDRVNYLAWNALRPIASWMGKPVGEALHFIGKLGYGAESKEPNLLMRWGTNWNKGMHRWFKDPAVAIENRAQAAGANVKLLKALGRAARWASRGGIFGGFGLTQALINGNTKEYLNSEEEPLPLKVVYWPFNHISPTGLLLNYWDRPFVWSANYGARELAKQIPAIAAVQGGGDNASLRAELYSNLSPRVTKAIQEAPEFKDMPWFLREDAADTEKSMDAYLKQKEMEAGYGKTNITPRGYTQDAPTAAPQRNNSSGIILNPDGSPNVEATEQNEIDLINSSNNVDQFYNYHES